jgi:hypothetical protein
MFLISRRKNREAGEYEMKITYNSTHLATACSAIISAVRCIVVFTAVNKQEPQQMWPQGVRVAFVGEEKQIGQV